MHIVVCPKRRNENMIMNGMIYAEEPTTPSSEAVTESE